MNAVVICSLVVVWVVGGALVTVGLLRAIGPTSHRSLKTPSLTGNSWGAQSLNPTTATAMDDFDFTYMQEIPSFEIGQRVRIKSYLGTPNIRALYVGREATVTGRSVMGGLWTGQVGYSLSVRGLTWCSVLPGSFLEAVIPGGAAPGSWDECPWKPPV